MGKATLILLITLSMITFGCSGKPTESNPTDKLVISELYAKLSGVAKGVILNEFMDTYSENELNILQHDMYENIFQFSFSSLLSEKTEFIQNLKENQLVEWAELKFKHEFPESMLKFTLIEDGTAYEVSSDSTHATNIVIPHKYNDLPVTRIGHDAFVGFSDLVDVYIPYGITYIGWRAFQKCTSLTQIIMPNSVTDTGDVVFNTCRNLSSIKMSNKLERIGGDMFIRTSITKIDIPFSVTYIGDGAFAGCEKLTNIIIPNNVTYLGSAAFNNCSSLTNITLSNAITVLNTSTFQDCSRLTDIIIPNSVTLIKDDVFRYCMNLMSVYIPKSVLQIYRYGISCPRVTVYAEVESKPEGWEDGWVSEHTTIIWGASMP